MTVHFEEPISKEDGFGFSFIQSDEDIIACVEPDENIMILYVAVLFITILLFSLFSFYMALLKQDIFHRTFSIIFSMMSTLQNYCR